MSFVNIKDNRRDEIVKIFLSLQKKIRVKDRAEIQAERGQTEALTKYFNPVTSKIEQINLKPSSTSEPYSGVLPPPIDENDDPELNEYLKKIEKIKTIQAEVTKEGVNFKMAGLPLVVTKNNIEYMGSDYKRTPELMRLLFSDDPPGNIKNKHPQAYNNFKNMMRDADILLKQSKTGHVIYNENISKRGRRWTNLLKIVADDLKQEQAGSGLLTNTVKILKKYKKEEEKAKQGGTNTIIIPSDPLALADRLSLLCGSIKAGNTGLKNEMVEVCNALIRKKLMSRKERDELLNTV